MEHVLPGARALQVHGISQLCMPPNTQQLQSLHNGSTASISGHYAFTSLAKTGQLHLALNVALQDILVPSFRNSLWKQDNPVPDLVLQPFHHVHQPTS